MKTVIKVLLWALGLFTAAGLAGYIAFQVTPWPGVIVIRWLFDAGAKATSAALVKHVPADVVARTDEVYDPASPDGKLDVYHPAAAEGRKLTTVVWVHGGGFVSGRKEDIGNYCRVLAGQGFTVVSVDYTIAPEAEYPTPVLQANAALGWLVRNAGRLPIDPDKLVLAGDSAGSHIVTQLANAITAPDYARKLGLTPAVPPRQLAGLLLHCGVYGMDGMSLDGSFGIFLRTVLRSYFGRNDYLADPRLEHFTVTRHVTKDFPPVFISAGNADPLLPQSRALAAALKAQGVRVDELFFPADYAPALPHEYQFNLDTAAGRQALDRTVRFLRGL